MNIEDDQRAIDAVLGSDLIGIDNAALALDLDKLIAATEADDISFPGDELPSITTCAQTRLPDHNGYNNRSKMNGNHGDPDITSFLNTPPGCPGPGFDYRNVPLPFNGHVSLPSPPETEPGSEPSLSPPSGHMQETNLITNMHQQQLYNHQNTESNKMFSYSNEPPKLSHHLLPSNSPNEPVSTIGHINPAMVPPPHYSMNMNNVHMQQQQQQQQNKKRKYSESPNGTINDGILRMNGINPQMLNNIKSEPGMGGMYDCDDDYQDTPYENPSIFLDGSYQVIKWQVFQPNKWIKIVDGNLKELPAPSYRVDADKGFNFSIPDDSFVCQKKNHFQVTVHINLYGNAQYVRCMEGNLKKIDNFCIHFYGIKMESISQTIKVEQSQSDRSKKAFHPVRVDLPPDQVTKITVGRLHFSETTSNNMRKKGKPNPDQRYFLLVVALKAHCRDESFMIAAHASERIIVRASNPGQFESDVDVTWQKGHTPDSVFHIGRVGVNTDRPDEALQVNGNAIITGRISQPSDMRAKENIVETDNKRQLENLQKLKIYNYNYKSDFAEHAGLSEDELDDTGVLAQELQQVMPDAVRDTGDVVLPNGEIIDNFLVINKDRLYMESIGAVKELCKLTDNLEDRIDELEKVNKKISKIKRIDSFKSTTSTCSKSTVSTVNSSIPPKRKYHYHHSQKAPSMRHPKFASAVEQEQGMCSNKFIQITVVALVLIMAFCLVSITTLYVLERNKPTPPNHNSHGLVGKNLGTLLTTPIPTSPTTSRQLTSKRVESTSGTADFKPSAPGIKQDTTPTTTTPSMASIQEKIGMPLPPPLTYETKEDVEIFCCPEKSDDDGHAQNDPIDPMCGVFGSVCPGRVEPGSEHAGTVIEADPQYDQTNNTHVIVQNSEDRKEAATHDEQGYNTGAINHIPEEAQNDPPPEAVYTTEMNNDIYVKKIRKKRNVTGQQGDNNGPNLQLDMPIIRWGDVYNKTLDRRYCQNCQETTRHYEYYIPVSHKFPDTINVELELHTSSSLVKVALCLRDEKSACPNTNPRPTQHPQGPLKWTLPVGFYFESKYTFHIAAIPTENPTEFNPCDPNVPTFSMYSFRFRRTC